MRQAAIGKVDCGGELQEAEVEVVRDGVVIRMFTLAGIDEELVDLAKTVFRSTLYKFEKGACDAISRYSHLLTRIAFPSEGFPLSTRPTNAYMEVAECLQSIFLCGAWQQMDCFTLRTFWCSARPS